MFVLFLILASFAAAAAAQDVLIYSSSFTLNGTDRVIETDPLCLTDAFQFNGSASLFAPEKEVWIKRGDLFYSTSENYLVYLSNPTTVPIDELMWWTFPCNDGDILGGISSYQYIPFNFSYAITAPCHMRLPVVYACEGEVPPTDSPSSRPSENPTIAPSHNPSLIPTRLPSRNPTNNAEDKVVGGVVIGILIAVLLWLSGDDRC